MKKYKIQFGEEFKENIKGLHNSYHPEAIFMTQTSATLYGWAIKEAWKEAWPDEKIPKIFTINVRPIATHQGEPLIPGTTQYKEALKSQKEWYRERAEHHEMEKYMKKAEEEAKRYNQKRDRPNKDWPEFIKLKNTVKSKLSKYNIKGNIAIIDEMEQGLSFGPDDKLMQKLKPSGHHRQSSRTLIASYWAVKSAAEELGTYKRVLTLGLGESQEKEGPWRRRMFNDSGYERVNTTKDRKRVKERISEFKRFGELMGKEISQGKLEEKVGVFIALPSLVLSLIFLQSNITGNAIANITHQSSNVIGVVLFIVGVVGSFLYFKRGRFQNESKKRSR